MWTPGKRGTYAVAKRVESHPSRKIIGSVNDYLAGRCIILGLTGSVSIYRSVDVARWLMRRGARIVPILTEGALEFVTPSLFHWATGEDPITRLTGNVEHIVLAEDCDAMLVAPATLSTISKIAYGITDNPVALTALAILGEGKPLIVVPAMHQNMMKTREYARAVEILSSQAIIIPPRVEEGIAKYPDPWVVARVTAAASSRGADLKGKRVLVTAGATREWIDPTRFISNPSSGRMGIELAVEAWARGAEVDLVYGHVEHILPHMVNLFPAETTEDMAKTVARLAGENRYDIALAAAAPADYRPINTSKSKIRSGLENLSLTLEPTPKVAEALRSASKYLVVFAAETAESLGELEDYAVEKMEKYRGDAVIANRVGTRDAGFSSPYLEALVIWRDGGATRKSFLGKIDKESLARLILDLSVKNMEAADNDEESNVR